MKKTLILFNRKGDYFFSNFSSSYISIDGIFRDLNNVERVIASVLRRLSSNYIRLFYGNWYKKITEFQRIIVFDATIKLDSKLLYNISKSASTKELYFYSWNIVDDEKKFIAIMDTVSKLNFKHYSFDKGNCQKYNLNFNTIMYDKKLRLESDTIQYDTVFLGFLKKRKSDIVNIYNNFKNSKLKAHFVIVHTSSDPTENFPFEYRDDYVDYFEYLTMINRSQSVLDIAQNGQDGYSMRVMESMFLGKKLITTNITIDQSDFFNENNILIYKCDMTTSAELIEFFNKPFIPYSEEILDYYSVEKWVERFTI